MGIYFTRYILFLDGRLFLFVFFTGLSFTYISFFFLFYWIVVYIDLYVKRGTSIVRGAAVLVLSVEDKAPKLASTVSS